MNFKPKSLLKQKMQHKVGMQMKFQIYNNIKFEI